MEQIRCVCRILYSTCSDPSALIPASLAAEKFIHFLLWGSCLSCISWLLQYLDLLCQHFQKSLEEHSESTHISDSVYDSPILWSTTRQNQDFWAHFHVSNERQRSWSRSEPLIWGASRSSGLQFSAGIQNYPEEPEEQNILLESCQTLFSLSYLGCVLGLATPVPIPLLPSSVRALASPGKSLLLQGHALKPGTHPHVLGSAPSCN